MHTHIVSYTFIIILSITMKLLYVSNLIGSSAGIYNKKVFIKHI